MPYPDQDHKFKPGQSGNPAGHSRSRRISDALSRFIDQKGLGEDLKLVIYAMASGQKHLLKQKVKDPETGKEVWIQRTPELGWLTTLLERTEGKVPDNQENDATNDGPSDAAKEAIARVYRSKHDDTNNE